MAAALNEENAELTAKEKAYSFLKQLIIEGAIKGGEFINERQVAESIGVSRTPIREAISRLKSENFVSVVAGRGAFANHISLQDVQSMFDLREALECLAVRLASERGSENPLFLRRIKDFHDGFERYVESVADNESDLNEELAINRDFHFAIAEAAENRYLAQMLTNLNDLDERIRISTSRVRARDQSMAQEHLAIATALLDGDRDGAVELMRRHIAAARESALKSIGNAVIRTS